MIGTLILAFMGFMTATSLILFALIRMGVIDQHMSLFLFVATVPLAAWVALGLDTVELGAAPFPPGDGASQLVRIDIEQLWPLGFDDAEVRARHSLRNPAREGTPTQTAMPDTADTQVERAE